MAVTITLSVENYGELLALLEQAESDARTLEFEYGSGDDHAPEIMQVTRMMALVKTSSVTVEEQVK